MKTNTNQYKTAIEAYLLGCIDIDEETTGTPTAKIQYFFEGFESYDHPNNRLRFPNTQERIADYL